MDSQPVTQTEPASEVNPEILALAQQITDAVKELVAGVDTLDANNWLASADKIDGLNTQLQNLLVTVTSKSTKSTK